MIMQTMQPTLRNGRNIWDRIHMPLQEFQGRIESLRKTMGARGIDALLAYGHAFDDYGNPCYLSHYMIRLPKGFLVALTLDEVALFFEGAARGLASAKRLTWVEDVRPCPDTSRECAKFLEEKSLTASKIGLAGVDEWMPQDQRQFLGEALEGCTLVDAGPLLREMRMIKSDRELDQIRRASRIVKTVFEKLGSSAFPDHNERVLEAMIIREARLEGAEDVRVLFGRPGQNDWALHPAGDESLETGEGLIIYLALVYERYWSEAARTFRVETRALAVPDLQGPEALYGELAGCLRPGMAISGCWGEITAKMEESGRDFISDYGPGQGIGLSPREWPILDQEAPGTLENGICLTLRFCMRDETLGSIMMGNTMAVTEGGIAVLTA